MQGDELDVFLGDAATLLASWTALTEKIAGAGQGDYGGGSRLDCQSFIAQRRASMARLSELESRRAPLVSIVEQQRALDGVQARVAQHLDGEGNAQQLLRAAQDLQQLLFALSAPGKKQGRSETDSAQRQRVGELARTLHGWATKSWARWNSGGVGPRSSTQLLSSAAGIAALLCNDDESSSGVAVSLGADLAASDVLLLDLPRCVVSVVQLTDALLNQTDQRGIVHNTVVVCFESLLERAVAGFLDQKDSTAVGLEQWRARLTSLWYTLVLLFSARPVGRFATPVQLLTSYSSSAHQSSSPAAAASSSQSSLPFISGITNDAVRSASGKLVAAFDSQAAAVLQAIAGQTRRSPVQRFQQTVGVLSFLFECVSDPLGVFFLQPPPSGRLDHALPLLHACLSACCYGQFDAALAAVQQQPSDAADLCPLLASAMAFIVLVDPEPSPAQPLRQSVELMVALQSGRDARSSVCLPDESSTAWFSCRALLKSRHPELMAACLPPVVARPTVALPTSPLRSQQDRNIAAQL